MNQNKILSQSGAGQFSPWLDRRLLKTPGRNLVAVQFYFPFRSTPQLRFFYGRFSSILFLFLKDRLITSWWRWTWTALPVYAVELVLGCLGKLHSTYPWSQHQRNKFYSENDMSSWPQPSSRAYELVAPHQFYDWSKICPWVNLSSIDFPLADHRICNSLRWGWFAWLAWWTCNHDRSGSVRWLVH